MIDIEIAMMASLRAKPYAPSSLTSMFERDEIDAPVRVVVCGDEAGFLGPWATSERVDVETLCPEVYAGYSALNIYQRITQTFLRCIEPAAERGRGLVLVQDDVAFARGWLKTVRKLHGEAKRKVNLTRHLQDAPVVLALFCAGKFKASDTPLAEYVPRRFYGNVGIYLSPKVLAPLVEFTRERTGMMDDMVLKQFLVQGKAHLLAVNPNIVQHTGGHSTHGGGFYLSPTFREKGHP